MMSIMTPNDQNLQRTVAAAAGDSAPPTPESLVAQLRAIRQKIPDFTPLPGPTHG
jgi:hypothetical protein